MPSPLEFESDTPLERAERNVYGIFPPGMNVDETSIARLLDRNDRVRWWHRNPSNRHARESLGLYHWDEGDGYYPDFVVAIAGRDVLDEVALLEVKGEHLWGHPKEIDKPEAVHPDCGRVFMVGRRRGSNGYKFLRKRGVRLEEEGAFDLGRMGWT